MLTFEHHQALAEIYRVAKDSKYSITKLQLAFNKKYNKNLIPQLANQDLVEKTTKSIQLTKKGLDIGYQSLRRIVVLRIFCQEILGISLKEAEEHIKNCFFSVNNYLLEKYCTLIGHASSYNIPLGECCQRAKLETSEKVLSLTKLPLNTLASVVYIKTHTAPDMQKLYELGIVPGESIKILQHYPTYIININDEQIALEETAANMIFVKK